MILADTSVWVDHFRRRDQEMYQKLILNQICIHPFVVLELVLGNLPDPKKTIPFLDWLPKVQVARTDEVRGMIEAHSLSQRGIGFVDVHLIASAFITPQTLLWTRDKQLQKIAQKLGLDAGLP